MDTPITELEEFEPNRVDGVKSGANGFPVLMLKAIDDAVVTESDAVKIATDVAGDIVDAAIEAAKADSADDDKVDCKTCKGSGKIMAGNRKCPDCQGSGKVGADSDAATKAKYKQADRDKMADAGQALPDGSYPVKDAADLDNAIHAVGRGGASHNAIRKHIMARAKALNLSSKIPDNWQADGSLGKALVVKDGGTMVTGSNPFGDQSTTPIPGSSQWEADDAQCATDAANLLMQAASLIQAFSTREGIEVAAGEGNDLFDEYDAQAALCAVTHALGVMARLAFFETQSGAEAEKSGRRLSNKTVDALSRARNHLNDLLGDDDPSKPKTKSADDADDEDPYNPDKNPQGAAGTPLQTKTHPVGKAVEDMNTDELAEAIAKVLDEREEARRTTKSTKKEAKEAAKAEAAEKSQAEEAERRAEMTPEEIDAEDAAKAVAETADDVVDATDKVLKELSDVRTAIDKLSIPLTEVQALKARLESVEKMAAPGGPVRARTPQQLTKSADRDRLELAIDDANRKAAETTDRDERKGYQDIAKDLRVRLADLPVA